jgi:hypothetical protein
VPEAGLDGFGVFSGGDEPGGVGVAEVVWHAGLTDGSGDGFAPDAAEGSSTEEPSLLGGPHIQVTMDRYGHLMEGLDSRTADRLDQIADTWSGPGAAQTEDGKAETTPENPLTWGNNRQPRPDSNRRFRLERPAS